MGASPVLGRARTVGSTTDWSSFRSAGLWGIGRTHGNHTRSSARVIHQALDTARQLAEPQIGLDGAGLLD
jgi:hypothetical protein